MSRPALSALVLGSLAIRLHESHYPGEIVVRMGDETSYVDPLKLLTELLTLAGEMDPESVAEIVEPYCLCVCTY